MPVARHERANPVLQRLLGAAGDQQQAHAGDGTIVQQLGQGDEHGHAGEVVVGSRHGRVAPNVGHQRRAERAHDQARPRRATSLACCGGSRGQRPGQPDPPLRRRRPAAFEQLWSTFIQPALQRLAKHYATLGGVVVGEHDKRPRRRRAVSVCDAGEQVDRRAATTNQPAHDPGSVLRLVDDPCECHSRQQGPPRAPATQHQGSGGHAEHT